jgi:hypothetical protein
VVDETAARNGRIYVERIRGENSTRIVNEALRPHELELR